MRVVDKSTHIIRVATETDNKKIMEIYNYYAENDYAVYANHKVESDFFVKSKDESISFYVLEVDSKVVGFCRLKAYLPFENFKHVGVLTYFIMPEYTHKGYGSVLYRKLEDDARKRGIRTLLAHASSLNNVSIKFHEKQGFKECGRFKTVAQKFGEYFDIVWMQKFLK